MHLKAVPPYPSLLWLRSWPFQDWLLNSSFLYWSWLWWYPWLLGCLHPAGREHGQRVSIRDGLFWFCQQAKCPHCYHSLSGGKGSAGGLWVGKDPIRASAAGDRQMCLAVILPSVLLCSSFCTRNIWQNGTIKSTWGLVCVCSCLLHCQPNAKNRSWKASSGQSVCRNRFPRNKWLFFWTVQTGECEVLWPLPLEGDFDVFCQRAEGRGAGRAHRDVRLERNQVKQQNWGTSQKKESCCVGGKEWSLGLCSCTCSLCSSGWEHGWFLLQQRQFKEHPMDSWVEVSPRALPKFSLPVADVLSPAGLYALFHLLLAAPARGSPSGHSPWGCLAVLELPQLRQPLHPLVHSCQAESCVWEPVGALGVCPGAAKSRFCPQPLPGSGGVSGHCMVM